MIDFILSHPWSCCMAWIIACFFGVAFIAAGTERDDEAQRLALRMFGRGMVRRVSGGDEG